MPCTCDYLSSLGELLLYAYFRFCSFLFWLINLFTTKKVVPRPRDPLLFKSVTELRKLLRSREVKPSEIVEAYIKRIEEVNPILNAVAFSNFEEAREQAKAADLKINELGDEWLEKLYDSQPLFGLPFTIKDSFKVKGKPCTVGILSRKKKLEKMTENAEAVQRMFDAGAILLAITTVPEAAMWVETNTLAYGRTNNPYDSRRIVGGSSGGEGALQGAGASLMGVGSDISGSIRIPSFCNGVFGLLPSPLKVPLAGHIPLFPDTTYSYQMCRAGPLTRFAEDIPLLSRVLSAGDIDQEERVPLKKLRIFYTEGLTHCKQIEPLTNVPRETMMKAVRHFEETFGITAQCIALPETEDLLAMQGAATFDENSPKLACLMEDITTAGPPVDCTKELLKALVGKSDYTLPLITLAMNPVVNSLTEEKYKMLAEKREQFKKRIRELLGEDGVIFYPSWPTQVPYHWETVLKSTTPIHAGLVNTLLLSAIQCPMGLTGGLPDGVQVVGNQGTERILMDVAQELSSAFGGWVPPGQ